MPASGPVENPKMFPAATMEDQEKIMAGEAENEVVLGGVPFSSPDPATDAKKMLPLEDGTSAFDAREEALAARAPTDYSSMKSEELKELAEERDLEVEGTGKGGRILAKDYAAALAEDDASDMKAADFKAQIEAAQDQEALDSALQLYADSGKNYSSVVAAGEKRQEELNEADTGDNK